MLALSTWPTHSTSGRPRSHIVNSRLQPAAVLSQPNLSACVFYRERWVILKFISLPESAAATEGAACHASTGGPRLVGLDDEHAPKATVTWPPWSPATLPSNKTSVAWLRSWARSPGARVSLPQATLNSTRDLASLSRSKQAIVASARTGDGWWVRLVGRLHWLFDRAASPVRSA